MNADLHIDLPPQRIWFTSDLHFGHTNIIKYSRRPFERVEEMDTAIIRGWNNCVQPGDAVFHLGDFAMTGDARRLEKWFAHLNGDRYAILGNHDVGLRSDRRLHSYFKSVSSVLEVKVRDDQTRSGWRRLFLHHFAQRVWNKSHAGAWHLYGHSHGSLPEPNGYLGMDVGLDATARRIHWGWDWPRDLAELARFEQKFIPDQKAYRPINYSEISEVLGIRQFAPADRHGAPSE